MSSLLPLFDTLNYLQQSALLSTAHYPEFAEQDFIQARAFLLSYNGSEATFNAYRREVERLLQWAWLVAEKSIKDIRRADIESYLSFCQSPPLAWIGIKKAPRYINKEGQRLPNPEWRPFVVTVSKAAHRRNQLPEPKNYALSQTALKEIFAILSSFYNFLIQEDYTEVNPLLQIRQKSKYFQKRQGKPKIRRLSELQWHFIIETAEHMAKEQPEPHQRTLFIMIALYAMYLRISELTASARWQPKMNDFHRDHDGLWWFTTVGKGNKERTISVSDAMLKALSDYRKFLGLAPLPSPADNSPLIPKVKGKGPITSATYLRKVVQGCFDTAIERLKTDGHVEEAESLLEATVHWLRHTGISDDVKRRPREHVRDDAGHSSGAITDKYIDVGLRERHASARKKPIKDN